MRNPIVSKRMCRKPIINPSYKELIESGNEEQTFHQHIATDVILANKLKHNPEARKDIGFRLAERMNIINFGETLVGSDVLPVNKWLDADLYHIHQDTDFVPNCN